MSEFIKESLSVSKPMFSLLEPAFLKEMADILTYGAREYGIGNWKKCPYEDKHLYIDAAMRHFESYRAGNMLDTGTGKHELAQTACNLMFLMYMEAVHESQRTTDSRDTQKTEVQKRQRPVRRRKRVKNSRAD